VIFFDVFLVGGVKMEKKKSGSCTMAGWQWHQQWQWQWQWHDMATVAVAVAEWQLRVPGWPESAIPSFGSRVPPFKCKSVEIGPVSALF
jgi:hypothetical protein